MLQKAWFSLLFEHRLIHTRIVNLRLFISNCRRNNIDNKKLTADMVGVTFVRALLFLVKFLTESITY